ncbi:hypothetical protein CULT_2640001 [[Clostridium] ultunense Esp]|nr:hypothetical protein CULT_2640001 [[Clostridium] ultunense Esp]
MHGADGYESVDPLTIEEQSSLFPDPVLRESKHGISGINNT